MRPGTDEVKDILSFDPTSAGITIFDHVEKHQCKIKTSDPVTIEEVTENIFDFPIDRGISIFSEEIIIQHTVAVCIRNHAGLMIDEFTEGDVQEFQKDEYTIEVSAPIKLYIKINSTVRIRVTSEQVILDLGGLKQMYLGARSHHERPAGTIETTTAPGDLIKAICCFGSALKTRSCERSYPTLRGHPPKLKIGNELKIPDFLENKGSEITIEVPKNYRQIFIITPLVYYLGANVIPSEDAKIKTEKGFKYELEDTPRGYESEVERVLKQCFFFDCITRTEGYYKVDLNERKEIESKLNLRFSSLYEKTIAEQIEKYLDISYDTIVPFIPKWKKTAHMDFSADNIEMLPFLADDLSLIRSGKNTEERHISAELSENSRVTRVTDQDKGFTRGVSDVSSVSRSSEKNVDELEEYVKISESSALEHTWVGQGIPIGASKAMIEAFENRLNQEPEESGNIDISVVVNDDQMIREGTVVDDVYSSRNQLAVNVELQHQLTTTELRSILEKEYDFFHYIGHIDKTGFECADGQLDVTEINDIAVRTFLLNACASYQQAIEFIRSGAIAGIATTKPVLNSGAERVGKAIGRLLNLGFPLVSALKIAKSESIMGENYVMVGDGGVSVTQAKSDIPSLCEIEIDGKNLGEDEFYMIYNTYLTRNRDIGTITIPYVADNNNYFLTSGETGRFRLEKNELLRFLSMGEMPIKIGSTLYWGDENEFINEIM